MKTILLRLSLALMVLGAVSGCAAQKESEMYEKASALTKLSSAVEAVVLYKNLPPTLTDSEILSVATEGSPNLRQEFAAFTVRIAKHEQGVIVLVCTANAKAAILEDVSCTAKMDRHHWRDAANTACAFTLSVPEACSQ